MKNGQARHGVEARRSHVKIIADADGVRVGIVRVDDWIFIRSVALIRDPHFGDRIFPSPDGLRSLRDRHCGKEKEREKKNAALPFIISASHHFKFRLKYGSKHSYAKDCE